uniref:Uncharacterized protein n=1 Tax=Meloidogyne enterolobii TaxID=390850 RepID=A0A6V7UT63_MELEN|nr:unnamed protein product [Meloidogyne enterolobii]
MKRKVERKLRKNIYSGYSGKVSELIVKLSGNVSLFSLSFPEFCCPILSFPET